MPDVSVIVTVYQCGAYIEECVTSIQNQSERNIEVIVIDDGSTDGGGEMCDSLAADDRRIQVIHKKNEGVSVARNLGIRLAKGDFIMFVDGDDFLEPGAIASLHDECVRGQLDICIGDYYYEMKGQGRLCSFFTFGECAHVFSPGERKELISNCLCCSAFGNPHGKTNVGVPWGRLYKADFIKKNHLSFQPGLRRMQDAIFNLYAFHHAKKVKYVPRGVYHYRFNDASVTNAYDHAFGQTADEVLGAAREFIRKYDAYYLEECLDRKTVLLAFEWIKLYVVPDENVLPRREKIQLIRKRCLKQENMAALHRSGIKDFTCTQKAGVLLWRLRLWRCLYWYYGMLARVKRALIYIESSTTMAAWKEKREI